MPEHIRQEPKVLVSTENLTEQEWLAYRRRGIGGSDVAAIFGISPFRTAHDLYDDKLNIASAADDAGNWVALEMGHLLEPPGKDYLSSSTDVQCGQRVAWILIFVLQYGHSFSVAGAGAAGFSNIFFAR